MNIIENMPTHIAIIMDGNGRWAQSRNKPRMFGHRAGGQALKEIVRTAGEIGLKYLSVFAFSTENWNRPKVEVDALMNLFIEYCKNEESNLYSKNVKVNFVGDFSALSDRVIKSMKKLEHNLSECNGLNLNICINYSGRNDILNAIKKIIREGHNEKEIDYDLISNSMFTSYIPDPDLLIRTSGEYRISNYFLWQLAYTELVFVDKLWPDFNGEDLKESIMQYINRDRRFGRI